MSSISVRVIVLLVSFIPALAAAGAYNKIFVFGDSLSDTGNFGAVYGPMPYPYYDNNITNGPVAVEVMAQELSRDSATALSVAPSLFLLGMNAGTNYAVIGARAHTNEVIDLNSQIGAFLTHYANTAPRDALYVVFLGGNDIRDARNEIDPFASSVILRGAVDGIDRAIRALIGAGARHFLVVNAPNLGAIPETRLIAQQLRLPILPALTTLETKAFNARLFFALWRIEIETGVRLEQFNLFAQGEEIANRAVFYGITNTRDYCFSSVTFEFNTACIGATGAPLFDQFYYFDEIHPTAKVHAIIGKRMAQAVARKAVSFPVRAAQAGK